MSVVPTILRIESNAVASWRQHKAHWESCERCELHLGCLKRVLARGSLPCEVLFIGEAPGESEDAIGKPFVGRAGRVLQMLLEDAAEKFRPFTYAITNVVACKPFGAGEEIVPPPPAAIEACRPRLLDFIDNIAAPDCCIALGKVAEKHALGIAKQTTVDHWTSLYHPSYILRKGGPSSLEYKRTLLALVRYLKEVLP